MLLSTIFPAFLIIPLASAAILNFDDLQAPNNPNCGSVSLATTPYNGFTITNAAVVNTTQTQFCHESSGGSGPWNKAQSLPNLLAGYNTIAFSSATKFKITAFKLVTNIHWTILQNHPELQVVITTTGKKHNGRIVKSEEHVYAREEIAMFPLALSGYKKLGSFEILVEMKYTEGGGEVRGPTSAYIDDVEYF